MRFLRWLAVVPLLLGLWLLLFAAIWTEWDLLLGGIGFLAVAAVVWRLFAGRWPLAAKADA